MRRAGISLEYLYGSYKVNRKWEGEGKGPDGYRKKAGGYVLCPLGKKKNVCGNGRAFRQKPGSSHAKGGREKLSGEKERTDPVSRIRLDAALESRQTDIIKCPSSVSALGDERKKIRCEERKWNRHRPSDQGGKRSFAGDETRHVVRSQRSAPNTKSPDGGREKGGRKKGKAPILWENVGV